MALTTANRKASTFFGCRTGVSVTSALKEQPSHFLSSCQAVSGFKEPGFLPDPQASFPGQVAQLGGVKPLHLWASHSATAAFLSSYQTHVGSIRNSRACPALAPSTHGTQCNDPWLHVVVEMWSRISFPSCFAVHPVLCSSPEFAGATLVQVNAFC